MVIKQKQFYYNSAINQINNANKEELEPFIEEYLNNHRYFKPKDVAIEYISLKHQITTYDLSDYDSIIKPLIHKISKLLSPYKLSGAIEKFNSITYQVINRNQPRIYRIP